MAELAKELGYTQAQLAIAWALASKDVSTLILGISKIEYIDENFKAFELYQKWNKDLEDKIENLIGNTPKTEVNFRTHKPLPSRRSIAIQKKLL